MDNRYPSRTWREASTRYLNKSLPFDTGKAILFLPEKGVCSSKVINSEGAGNTSPEKHPPVSGQKTKELYEEILSMPSERRAVHRKRPDPKMEGPSMKLCMSHHQRSKSGRILIGQANERPPTIGQMFRFSQDGRLDSLKKSLFCGYHDVNITDTFNWSLLMSAAFAGHIDTVEYLLSVGGEWRNIVDQSGLNAADLARSAGHHHIADLIENYHTHFCPPSREHSGCSHQENGHTDHSDNISSVSESQRQDYYCERCQIAVPLETSSAPHDKHTTSTLHQFNCQHHPSPHTVYAIPQSNRGYQMLLKKGWDPQVGLGSQQEGQKFPIKTILKRDRLGIGLRTRESSKAKVTHFQAEDKAAIMSANTSNISFKGKRFRRKKDIISAAIRDKTWETRMRKYMSSEHD